MADLNTLLALKALSNMQGMPQMYNGGSAPPPPDDEEDDSPVRMPAQSAPAPDNGPIHPPMIGAGNNSLAGASDSDEVKDAIAKKYQLPDSLTPEAMADAQKAQAVNQLGVNLGQAGDRIAYGIAGVPNPTPDAYAGLQKSASAPVDMLKAKQGQDMQAYGVGQQMELDNPDSPISQKMQGIYSKLLGVDPNLMKGLSASELKQAQSPAEVMAKLKETSAIAQLRYGQQQGKASDKADREDSKALQAAASKAEDATKDLQSKINENEVLAKSIDEAVSNPSAASAATIMQAKSLITGRLNQAELNMLGGSKGSVVEKIEAIAQKAATGTLEPQQADYMRRFSDVIRESTQRQYQEAVAKRADSFIKSYPDFDKTRVYAAFHADPKYLEGAMSSRAPKGGPNMQGPSVAGGVEIPKPDKVEQADWDKLSPVGKKQLSDHLGE